MKTTLQPNCTTLSFKLIGIISILVLNVCSLHAQTGVKNPTSKSMLKSIFQYQQKTNHLVSAPKVYSVFAAKDFPIIQSGINTNLMPMDDSIIINYDLFCSKANLPGKPTETSLLALNSQIQNQIRN